MVLLPIALRDGNRAIVVINTKRVICNIPNASKTAAAVQQRLEACLNTGPHFDTGAVASICERDVVDVKVLDNIGLVGVLSQRAYTYPVGTRAV